MQDIKEFPQRGGANGSIRFYPEINHGANAGGRCSSGQLVLAFANRECLQASLLAWCACSFSQMSRRAGRATCFDGLRDACLNLSGLPVAGLAGGVKLLQGLADKYDGVSYADLFQMASAIAVKVRCSQAQACVMAAKAELSSEPWS